MIDWGQGWAFQPGARKTPLPVSVQTKLIDPVFKQRSTLIAGSVNTIGVGLFCFARSGEPWLMIWVAYSIAVLAGRLVLAGAYRNRDQQVNPGPWADRFTIGAALAALGWGMAGMMSILHLDAFGQMVMITGQSTYVTTAAVRNNSVFRAAMLQTSPLAFTILACVETGSGYYAMFSLFILVYLAGAIAIIRYLHNQTLELLIAKDSAAATLDELTKANRQLENLVTTDALTGVINRRGFDQAFAKECARATRDSTSLSLLIIDIDHFKRLNDTLGHQAGDECLRRLADCLKSAVCRPGDLVARYGGEEFAVILPDTGAAGAAYVAGRFCRAVEALAIPHETSPFGVVTVSAGCTTWERGSPAKACAMIKFADDALYAAKNAGRNRVSSTQGETAAYSAAFI